MAVGGPPIAVGGDDDNDLNGLKPKNTLYLYVVSLLSALGGLLFGYDTGVVSGSMVFIKHNYLLGSFWVEAIVSVTIAGAWLFSMFAGQMTDRFGRRPVILLASIIFTVGALVMGAANGKWMLLVGRAIVGAAIGMSSMCVPMYIAEVAPQHIRGKLVTLNHVFITIGMLVAAIISGLFSHDPVNGWRWMLGFAGVPSTIQFIGFIFLPESPRWLVANNREPDAVAALHKLRFSSGDHKREVARQASYDSTTRTVNLSRGGGDSGGDRIEKAIEKEISAIRKAVADGNKERQAAMDSSDSSMAGSVAVRVFKTASVRKALFVGCMLPLVQQLSGINTVMYYSATIIEMSGVDDRSTAVWMACGVAAVNFLCTFGGLFLVERVGRRTLVLVSCCGVGLMLVLLGTGFNLAYYNLIPVTDHMTPLQTGVLSPEHCNTYDTCMACVGDSVCGFCYIEDKERAQKEQIIIGSCIPAAEDNGDVSAGGFCQMGGYNGTILPEGFNGTDPLYRFNHDSCPQTPSTEVYPHIILGAMIVYLLFYGPGMGPMPWTINSEIYPLWARSFCYSIITATHWLFNFLVSITFLSLCEAITRQGAFWLYAGIALSGFLFFFFMLPETGGRSLEDIEDLFMGKKNRRNSVHIRNNNNNNYNFGNDVVDDEDTIGGKAPNGDVIIKSMNIINPPNGSQRV